MGYLITHIALYLLFSQLLGLLLGWLLWGYNSRRRSQELRTHRERLANMSLRAQRPAIPEAPRKSLAAGPAVLMEGDVAEADAIRSSSFPEEQASDESTATGPTPIDDAASDVDSPDLELEVKNLQIQHLERQLREFEAVKDRLSLLQANLSDAISLRRAAESRLEEARNDFERRSSSVRARIQSFENAANEWDRVRDELERAAIAKDKEVSAVKGQLRDLQNSQRPETADPLVPRPSPEALELSELRERHQTLVKERDAIAFELELRKQDDSAHASKAAELAKRVAELEAAVRIRDASLREHVTRIESLLWHVAELEPFAAAASHLEEDLRRQEAEITAHLAMHSENVEKLRSLERLTADHASQIAGLQELLARKDGLIAERSATVSALEKSLAGHAAEIRGLLAAQGAIRRDVETWKDRAGQWEQLANRVPDLENTLRQRDVEIVQLKDARDDKERQLTLLEERLTALSDHLAGYQQRLAELETLAGQAPALEERLAQREAELIRLKVSSAQRIRRIRQSITNFKP